MIPVSRPRRRAARPLAATALAGAVLATTLCVAAPASAAYGSPQPVDLQLRGYSSSGYEYLVGRLVGTVEFDDGNSGYRLSLTLCRQSSYTNPNVRIGVNGTPYQTFSPSDEQRRPGVCGGGHGMSGVIGGDFTYGGVVRNLSIGVEGILFDGSTAKTVSRGASYDNPFN